MRARSPKHVARTSPALRLELMVAPRGARVRPPRDRWRIRRARRISASN